MLTIKDLVAAGQSAAVIFPSLWLWRYCYALSDWAALLLLPLTALLLRAAFLLAAELNRRRLAHMLDPASPWARLLNGRIMAAFTSMAYVTVAILLLAWQSLLAGYWEWVSYISLSLVAALLYAWLIRFSRKHFQQPFDRHLVIRFGALVLTVVAIPFLTWVNFTLVDYSAAILQQDLQGAVMAGFDALPNREGWLTELLAPLFALDALKLWLATREQVSGWATFAYSVDAAVFGFIIISVSMQLTEFFSSSRQQD